MAVSCEAKCGKSILISFTLVHWLAGGAILVLGACILLQPAKLFLFNFVTSDKVHYKEYGLYLAYFLFSLSAVIFIVGIFGCCGAIEENRGLLVVYVILLLLLLLTNMVVAVFTLVYRDFWLVDLNERLRSQLFTDYGPRSGNEIYSAFTNAMDFSQYKFECCGINGDEDYQHTRWWNESMSSTERRNVPSTCCTPALEDDPQSSSVGSPISVVSRVFHGTVEEPWQSPSLKDYIACQDADPAKHAKYRRKQGCIAAINEWFRRESSILAVVAISAAVLQMIGMILAVCLCRNLTMDI